MQFKIIDLDSRSVARTLLLTGNQVGNMHPTLNAIGLDMLEIEKAVFASQGRRGGGSWKRLKPETVRKKGSTEILRTENSKPTYSNLGNDTLYKSVTRLGAPFQVFNIGTDSTVFGTDRPHAETHQYGSSRRNIPARPFIRFTRRDIDRWSVMIRDHLTRPFVRRARTR